MDRKIIEDAKDYALSEIEKFGTPYIGHLDLAAKKALELAERLGADRDIAEIGTYLMDIKLGEARKQGKKEEHVKMGVEAAKNFLNQYNLDIDTKNRIINCVEAHHGTAPFICKEAEIACNADCYRFIYPAGVFGFLILQGSRSLDLNHAIDTLKEKLEEKHKALSLDICKQELEPYYQMFKKFIDDVNL
ncbi:MAG: hypothetical protein WCT40_03050 [Candidatus Magasanikbacteria bacterium]|jgi:hypothetical protein